MYANDHRGHGNTADTEEELGHAGKGGWDRMVDDVFQLTGLIIEENPGLPVFILGHSMGSFILRQYMYEHRNLAEVKGFMLSATGGSSFLMLKIALFLCNRIIRKHGIKEKNKFIHELTFKNFDARCEEKRTLFDWLSRDKAQVDKYINDPLCGQICTVGFYYDFFNGILEIQKLSNVKKLPKNIPVYIFSGEMDPVGQYGKKVTSLYRQYKSIGIIDVTCKLYEGGRHEMLNETNRHEVESDILLWLNIKNYYKS